MALKYPELFKPYNIGKLRIKNRVSMAPMHLGGRMDDTGNMTEEVIDYFEAQAKGGFGLIISGGYGCAGGAEITTAALNAMDNPPAFNSTISKAAEKINAYDAKFLVEVGAPFGRVAFLETLAPEMNGHPVAPSAVPARWDPSVMCRALTTEECQGLIDNQVIAAVTAARAGADGICVGGAYGGYFAGQFAIRAFNQRDDEFGFAQGGQYRVVTDVIKGIKEQMGQDYPVIVRLCVRHYMKDIGVAPLPGEAFTEHGRDVEDSLALAKALEDAGAGITMYTSAKFAGWKDGVATVIDAEGKEQKVEAETVVQAVGFAPNNALYKELEANAAVPVWNIGDSKEPANVMEAVRGGFFVGKNI